MVSKQFYSYVERQNLISPQQYGFRRNRSSVDQLVNLTTTISNSFDNKQLCDGVFLDFSKAFDRVDHSVNEASISGWCCPDAKQWLMEFITGRSIRVNINGATSTTRNITAGVPQGSHLGPLLFNLSINSLTSIPHSSSVNLFADDTNLLASSGKQSTAAHYASLQTDVNESVSWCRKTATQLNIGKCTHIPFSPREQPPPDSHVLTIENTPLTCPSSHRHLGIVLTPSLSFSLHIDNITHKFRGRVFLLRNMSLFLPCSTISILFKSYVRPLLEYGIPVWMFSLSSIQSDTLDKLQATACRAYLLSKSKSQPSWTTPKHDLNSQCNWESLEWRRQILALAYFHHVFYAIPSLLFEFGFRLSHSPRHPSSVILPKSGTYLAKSPLFLLSIAWNKLPEDVRSLESPSKFKCAVRRHFASHKFSLKGIPFLLHKIVISS